MARRMGFDKIIVETDSFELYRGLLHMDSGCSWKVGVIVEDIQALLLQFASYSLVCASISKHCYKGSGGELFTS